MTTNVANYNWLFVSRKGSAHGKLVGLAQRLEEDCNTGIVTLPQLVRLQEQEGITIHQGYKIGAAEIVYMLYFRRADSSMMVDEILPDQLLEYGSLTEQKFPLQTVSVHISDGDVKATTEQEIAELVEFQTRIWSIVKDIFPSSTS